MSESIRCCSARVRAILKFPPFGLRRRRRVISASVIFQLCTIWAAATTAPPPAPDAEQRLQTYKLCWQFPTDRTTSLQPAAQNNTIFFPSSDGEIVALNAADGSVVWRAALGGNFIAAPTANRTTVFAASQTISPTPAAENSNGVSAMIVRGLSAATGVTVWQIEFPQIAEASLALDDNALYVAARDAGGKQKLLALAPETGSVRWSKELTAQITTELVFADANIYFGAADNSIASIRAIDGAAGRRYELRRPVQGALAAINGIFVFGDRAGSATALRRADERVLWTLRTGGAIQSISGTSRGALIASLDNFVYLHSLPKGKRRWRRRLSARPASVKPISPEAILLLASGEGSAFIAALKNGKIFGQITFGADDYAAAPPILIGNRLVIPTLRGISVFADNADCSIFTTTPEIKKDAGY